MIINRSLLDPRPAMSRFQTARCRVKKRAARSESRKLNGALPPRVAGLAGLAAQGSLAPPVLSARLAAARCVV